MGLYLSSHRNDVIGWQLGGDWVDMGGGVFELPPGDTGTLSVTTDFSTTSGSGGVIGGQDGFYTDLDIVNPVTAANQLPVGFQILDITTITTGYSLGFTTGDPSNEVTILVDCPELGIPSTNVSSELPFTYGTSPSNDALFSPFTYTWTITNDAGSAFNYQFTEAVSGTSVFSHSGNYDLNGIPPGTEVAGWYESRAPGIRAGQDAILVINQPDPVTTKPKAPRGMLIHGPFTEDNPFWGHPGHAVALGNKLYYAAGDYEIGVDYPTIRVWDGFTDTEVCKIPIGLSGNIPFAITCMIPMTDRYILVGVWNSGLTSTTATGSLLRLKVSDGSLTTMGFSQAIGQNGHIPSAVVFANDKIFVGSHRLDDPTAGGGIWRSDFDVVSQVPGAPFWPNIVSDATLEGLNQGSIVSINMSPLVAGEVTRLIFGTTAPAGTRGGVGAIDPIAGGAITAVMAGIGGTAQDWNGFYALTPYYPIEDNIPGGDFGLLAAYWNPDTPAISYMAVNNAGDDTVYTDATGTQIMSLVIDGKISDAIEGGITGVATAGTCYAFGARLQSGVYTGLVIYNKNPEDLTEWIDIAPRLVLSNNDVTLATRAPTNAFGVITV